MDYKDLHILLVDDDEDDYALTSDLLSEIEGVDIDLDWIEKYDVALEAIERQEHDIYLVDYRLGQQDGLALLRAAVESGCKRPMILLTGQGDREVDIQAMDAGAADFLVKGQVDASLLERSIRYSIERKRVETELRELDRMKAEFVATVSHELRTPLHSIKGFTKLLVADRVPDAETQKEFLTLIDQQSTRLGTLIDDLLDVSRLESGQLSMDAHRLVVQDVIAGAVRELRALAEESGVSLEMEMPPVLPEVEADGDRLRQVMVNLLGNAIKFSDAGSHVTACVTREKGFVTVSVADEGIGMPAEAVPRLFDRFYRVASPKTRATGGTGLGLYITKQIVEAHGGTIWVESALGKGSTFHFKLPVDFRASVAEHA